METLELSSPFEELASHDVVVAYETRDSGLDELLGCLPDEYVDIDLGGSEKLKTAFMEYFKLSGLPAVILKGSAVVDNIRERMHDYSEERKRATLDRIQKAIDPGVVTVFIKGSPTVPRCGFTRSLVDILHRAGLTEREVRYFDILSDEEVRRKLKEVNNWPTFPQVYIRGEFVGGLDVIKKMEEKGQLGKKLSGIGAVQQ